jgi:hypothetical protein
VNRHQPAQLPPTASRLATGLILAGFVVLFLSAIAAAVVAIWRWIL